VVVRTWYT